MNYKSYGNISNLYYYMKRFNTDITDEMLMSYFFSSSMEEVYETMPKDEIEFVKEWLSANKDDNDNDNHKFFIDKIKDDLENLSQEDLQEVLMYYINDILVQRDIFRALPDKSILINLLLEETSIYSVQQLFNNIPNEELISLVNNDDPIVDTILQFWGADANKSIRDQYQIISQLDSDLNRTKLLLYGVDKVFLPEIEDPYYKNQVTKSRSKEFGNVRTEIFLSDIEKYNKHLDKISSMQDEKEKAEYIAKAVTDNEMKESFLFSIKDRENRDKIISSFNRLVDSDIEDIDNLARTMISEFFEDKLGENYTDDKKDRVNIVFNKTTVYFDELEENINGRANFTNKSIRISEKRKGNINRLIHYLIHEYAHMFSNFYYSYIGKKNDDIAEEGMADTFSELVINHYLSKHKEVFMNGKKVRIDYPYVCDSAYDYENSIARTMLAGLEKEGKDIEAACEYVIGHKSKFAEMVFGTKEVFNTEFEDTKIKTNENELYYSPVLDFSNINEKSLYYRRNCILPLFQLQNKLGDSIDLTNIVNQGQYYKASYVADLYFDDKEFYEVPKEDLSEFMRLLEAQMTPNKGLSPIQEVGDYKNSLFNSLKENEIRENSFEILERITSVFGKEIDAGETLESVIKIALEEEIRKINDGQPDELTKEKVRLLRKEFANTFTGGKASNKYINDFIKDFYFELSQIEERTKKEDSNKNITTQQIGSATIDASITTKNEASSIERREMERVKDNKTPDKRE